MAKQPSKTSSSRVSNIMRMLRGNIDFNTPEEKPSTLSVPSVDLLSYKKRTQILAGAFSAIPPQDNGGISRTSLLQIAQSSLSKVGKDRLENRKILNLLPSVKKAARLMIASTLAPNDLTRKDIPVVFDIDGLTPSVKKRLEETATEFFQDKLKLRKSLSAWMYQFGYEAGSSVFAIVPLQSFADIQESSYIGTEALVKNVVDPLSQKTIFGFCNNPSSENDVVGLESLFITSFLEDTKGAKMQDDEKRKSFSEFIKLAIAKENLSLTDNPSILQIPNETKKQRKKRSESILNGRYQPPREEMIVSVDPQIGKEDQSLGDPIFMRLPPESVTIIHTPGEPGDHQGYLVLLDQTGNPIDAGSLEDRGGNTVSYNEMQGNLISQIYSAYGVGSQHNFHADKDVMTRLYTQIVSEHLRKRLDGAGYNNTSVEISDSVMRCMFGRFLQQKQTRILFLPKELVTYMTFEKDQHGYGISRLDSIKFTLGMKMAVQVSRVLAAIKAAMDKRNVTIDFTDNMIENPEAVFNSVVREYLNKSTISFSIDPNVIQHQIADKSLSIQGRNIPGMEAFSMSNEPDNKASVLDFDPSMLGDLDKDILNGLHIPASTMNSLDEDEFARSVTTTNLFFSMDVSVDQDTVIHQVSDLLRKYAMYSQTFRQEIEKQVPALKSKDSKDKTSIESNLDDKKSTDKTEETLPEGLTIDKLIKHMSISLPKPNVAPGKAQFEALSAMIESITSTVTALFPDDFVGQDDTNAATVRLLRAKILAKNIRAYLETSGMNMIEIPDSDFTDLMMDVSTMTDALDNVTALLKDKSGLKPKTETEDTAPEGY